MNDANDVNLAHVAYSKIGCHYFFSASSVEFLYFKSSATLMKNVLFTISGVVITFLFTVDVKFYLVNSDKWSDTNTETSQRVFTV